MPSGFSTSARRCAAAGRVEKLAETTRIDPWFLSNIKEIVDFEADDQPMSNLLLQSRWASATSRSALRLGIDEEAVRALRGKQGIQPGYKLVDTCAAEFEASTPYYYSTYDDEDEARPDRTPQDHDPRRRAEPHRPGHRVRLLLRARRLRAARDRLRDDHGQLQSRDRLDRLRHLRPAVLRAADARGRARHRATGRSPTA